MTTSLHGKSLHVVGLDYVVPEDAEVDVAEGGQEAVGITDAAHAGASADSEGGFTYGATTEGTSLDLEPGFELNWPAGERRYFRVLAEVAVGADGIAGPEEGAEDAVDLQVWDLEGEVLAKSVEAEAAGGGIDVAEGPTTFNIDSPVISMDNANPTALVEDGLRLVVVNRPSGGEAADGEAVTYDVTAGTFHIVPVA